MRQVYYYLVIVFALLANTNMYAFDCEVDGIFYDLDKTNKIAAVTYNKINSQTIHDYSGDIVIPQAITHDGITYTVTRINKEAFAYCEGITSVSLPDSLMSIGDYAFAYCNGLTSIIIPSKVKSLYVSAFRDCKSLTTVILPDELENIGMNVFSGCSSLSSITIPDNVKNIYSYAFRGCSNLSTINLPKSAVYLEDDIFSGCIGLKNVIICCDPSDYGNSSFTGCDNITTITYHCKSIHNYLYNKTSLKEIVIGEEVLYIDNNAFQGYSGLETITSFKTDPIKITETTFDSYYATLKVPRHSRLVYKKADYWKNFTNIEEFDVPGMDYVEMNGLQYVINTNTHEASLTYNEVNTKVVGYSGNVTIPEAINYNNISYRVVSIEPYAFYGSSNFTAVTISRNIECIKQQAFSGCVELEKITCLKPNPPILHESAFDSYDATLQVPIGCKTLYTEANNWRNFTKIVEIDENGIINDKEAYAALSEMNTVLTFYYDNQKETRQGISLGSFSFDKKRWNDEDNNITTVVFDASFANNTYLRNTSCWFARCGKLNKIVGIEYLNTDNVEDMSFMFYDCSSLKSLDVTNFNTSNVKNMRGMFCNCSSITTIDVSNFNTSNVENVAFLFFDCSSITSLDVSNFNTSNINDMSSMFAGCSSLTFINVSNFNTSNVRNMFQMFSGCSSLKTLDVSNFNTSKVNDMSSMFAGCSSLTFINVSNFNTSNVRNMFQMFSGCSSLKTLDVSNFDTSNVNMMSYMFSGCSSLTSLDISNLNTSNVGSMETMFCNCSSLTTIDVSNFNTSNVYNMNSMFDGCSSLITIDVSNFNTSNVRTMTQLFCKCSSITSLDLVNFDMSKVEEISHMFYNCSFLRTIYTKNWDLSTNMKGDYMFDGCTKLVGGKGTVYDASHTDYTYARIDGGESAPGYFTDKNSSGINTIKNKANAKPKYIYSLDGKKYEAGGKLPKGIYIMNGVKEIIK